MKKLIGIKKAVIDFNAFINCGLYARVYLNKRTGKVWTREYLSENNYTRYDDENIIEILWGDWWYPKTINMKTLREAAESKIQ